MTRDPALQRIFDLTEKAISLRASECEGAAPAAERVFKALRNSVGPKVQSSPAALPVHSWLPKAIELSANASSPVRDLAKTIGELSAHLPWGRRPGTEKEGEVFANGHANVYLAGPHGLERRSDVWLGISLMAPWLLYPVHDHAPEEVYVSLAGGAWWKRGSALRQPGVGGLIYNEPGVGHTMVTTAEPLLAVWCLWAEKSE